MAEVHEWAAESTAVATFSWIHTSYHAAQNITAKYSIAQHSTALHHMCVALDGVARWVCVAALLVAVWRAAHPFFGNMFGDAAGISR